MRTYLIESFTPDTRRPRPAAVSQFLATLVTLTAMCSAPVSLGQLAAYQQNFEAMEQMSPSALMEDDWVVFGNVYSADGLSFLYQYGTFPAPNFTNAFSNVGAGEGGAEQGSQQLVVFSDYNNADHGIGFLIESNIYQEQIIGVDDVGEDVIFRFDAKRGDLQAPSTAQAFIKTIDPGAGYILTWSVAMDTSDLSGTWGTYELSITIDPGHVGQLLQFGFSNISSNYNPSGVVYDNVVFLPADVPDTDGDGVTDDADNCLTVQNADQRDSNGDGYGNVCDTDLNNDCTTNPIDLGLFRSAFFTSDPDSDFDGNGIVNPIDLGVLKSRFFQPPGPGLGTCF